MEAPGNALLTKRQYSINLTVGLCIYFLQLFCAVPVTLSRLSLVVLSWSITATQGSVLPCLLKIFSEIPQTPTAGMFLMMLYYN